MDRRGQLGPHCTVFVTGNKALQLVLYELGEKPGELIRDGRPIHDWDALRAEASAALQDWLQAAEQPQRRNTG